MEEPFSPVVWHGGSGRRPPAENDAGEKQISFRNPFKIMFRIMQLANKARRAAAAKALKRHQLAGSTKTRHQGDLETHYTGEMLKRRKIIRYAECVEVELAKFWKSAYRHHNHNDAPRLDREDYRGLHGRMVQALHEEEDEVILSSEEMQQAFEDDWRADSHIDSHIDGGETGYVDKAKLLGPVSEGFHPYP
jgi:hypothetical protein